MEVRILGELRPQPALAPPEPHASQPASHATVDLRTLKRRA